MFLYAIRAEGTGFIKIGVTSDLSGRLRQIQTGSAYPLRYILSIKTSFARKVEQHLHRQLAHNRQEGEWFVVKSDLEASQLIRAAVIEHLEAQLNLATINAWASKPRNTEGFTFNDLFDRQYELGLTDDDFHRLYKRDTAEYAILRRQHAALVRELRGG